MWPKVNLKDLWLVIVWGGPALAVSIVFTMFGLWGAGFGFALAWIGFCLSVGTVILKQNQFAVMERLGNYHIVFFRGWNVRVIGIDRMRETAGDLRAMEYELYSDERKVALAFTDGTTAPVVVKVWYKIGRPEDSVVDSENWKRLTEAIKLWAYAYKDPLSRIYALVDGEIRWRLQSLDIDTANKTRNGIASDAMVAVREGLAALGVYEPRDQKLVVIEDIALPPEAVALRLKVLEGEKRAQEQELEAAGYWKAIRAIRDNLGVSVQEARAIYETQRGLETLSDVGPAMTLIGENFGRVLGTINLGGKNA